MYKVTSNVPLPKRCAFTKQVKRERYPFARMEPPVPKENQYDSFLEKKKSSDRSYETTRCRVMAAANTYARKNPPVKFASRVVPQENGVRVWRIK